MGLRGPNAKPVEGPLAVARDDTKKHPWNNPKLTRAERAISFLETLPVTSGKLAGSKFKVRSWQREQIIDPIYATDKNGRRIVREALITMPRKNGKTGLTAGLTLLHFVGPESVERGELYSAAAKRKQAAKLFEEMKAIIKKTPWMAARIIIRDFNKQLEDVVTGSIYYALAAEASTEHGGNTSFWVYDELAQAKNRALYDVLKTSTGAQEEPLGIVISTQSHDPNHIMSELVDYGLQIRDAVVSDPSFVASIFTAPEDADPWDEATWHQCNPALGDFRDLEEMRAFAKQAKSRPALEATFRLLYLNQRVQAETRFLPKALWTELGKAVDLKALKGKSCCGAIDLSGSGKNDLTCVLLLFEIGEEVVAVPFFWAAEGGLEEAEKRDRAPYRLWAKQGHLITTPGNVLDYGFIAHKIGELSIDYEISCFAIDPWNHDRLVAKLNDLGLNLTMQIHGQGVRDMSPSVTALENDAVSKKLRHNNNPILTWCMDNVMVSHDSAGNRKFDKRKSTGRIDGAVALAMAEGLRASQSIKEPQFQAFLV